MNTKLMEEQKKAAQQFTEIRDLNKNLAEIQEINKTFVEELNEQKKTNNELKKDLVKVQAMNDKLVEELEEQKKTNDGINKAISQIEQRLTATEKLLQIRSKRNTTQTANPSPENNCNLRIGSSCYFAVMQDEWVVNYAKAVDICKERNADVGSIRDEESYNAIMNYLIKNIPKSKNAIQIWIGNRFDPLTFDVIPKGSFIKWVPGNPVTGIVNKHRKKIYLDVRSDPNDRDQGMLNAFSIWKRHGVICEI
ncbi:uncharacterized protein LOC120325947 [Styela clava]